MANNLHCRCPRCSFEYVIPLERELIRTLPQNALYHGVYVKILAEEFGEFHADMHEILKKLHNPKASKALGETYGGTTTKMTRKEFSAYIDKIRLWAMTEHNIDLPEAEK